jgi:isoleucyl-tRNA synthetase
LDWKTTLNLPKTEFPMRADLARREPEWLARWARDKQYERILEIREKEGAPPFVLHDGPPYPTGGIHYGTVLNKVLKDIVVRSQLLMGKRAEFRPGWDCHGLPIEQQVEKELGPKAKEMDAAAFRGHCEKHALKFVDVMRTEFKRLGCLGRWDDPYLTLSKDYEAAIARQLAGFARAGLVYRDKKPVHWCLTHHTALAEAEVEYEDHASPSIYVRFPVVGDLGKADARLKEKKAAFVIWTTTPWTLPANLAVVANPELDYVAIPHQPRQPVSGTIDEYLIVAAGLAEAFLAATGIDAPKESWIAISRAGLQALEGTRYVAPFPRPNSNGARAHRARSRRGRLRRRSRPWPHDLRTRRRERPLHHRGRARRAQRRARVRRQPQDRRAAGGPRPAAEQGGGDHPPPVSLLLALQEPDHLPRHAAVVRAARRGRR